MNATARIATWKYDAPFTYSVAYDEGTVDCLANAFPIHEQYGFPGHVNVVSGQIGRRRNCFRSSLNGRMHMSTTELAVLTEAGWSIGNHSWSHFVYPCQPGLDLYREIVWARYRLEDILGHPVRVFALPNDAYNYEPMIDLVKSSHMACIANCFMSPNAADVDLYEIGNMRLSSAPYPPRESWPEALTTDFIDLSHVKGGWLHDTTHLCMWDVPQPHKCITPVDLSKRFEKHDAISEGKLWAASVDDIIDYILMRRSVSVSIEDAPAQKGKLQLNIDGAWPVGVRKNDLSLVVDHLPGTVSRATMYAEESAPPGTPRGPVDIDKASIDTTQPGRATITAPVWPGTRLELEVNSNG